MNRNKSVNEKNKENIGSFAKFIKNAAFTLICVVMIIAFWVLKLNGNTKLLGNAQDNDAANVSFFDKNESDTDGEFDDALIADDDIADIDFSDSDVTVSEDGGEENVGSENWDSGNGENPDSDESIAGSNENVSDEVSDATPDETENIGAVNEPPKIVIEDIIGERDPNYRWPEAVDYCGETVGAFYYYKPAKTNSRYYYDVGRIALTTDAEYQTVEDDYFDDVCFVGDSRAIGIHDYSGWENADFLCSNGYCVYDFTQEKTVKNQSTGKKCTLQEAMDEKQYGKIYIMLGINDCGYGTTESFQDGLADMVNMVIEKQPNAIIYLVANMHISKSAEKESSNKVFSNININAKNVAMAELANGINIFYLDYNDSFTDAKGYLIDEYTFDGFHLYAKQYAIWSDFFREHAILNIDFSKIK